MVAGIATGIAAWAIAPISLMAIMVPGGIPTVLCLAPKAVLGTEVGRRRQRLRA